MINWGFGLIMLCLILLFPLLGNTEPKPIKVTLVNHSKCSFEVKVNHVPAHICQVNTEGPLVTLPPDTVITITVLSKIGDVAFHVPAFGINKVKGSKRPVIVGHQCTSFPKSVCDYFSCSPCVEYRGLDTAPMVIIQ